MSSRRSGPSINLAPPSPSPARAEEVQHGSTEGAVDPITTSAERPVASTSTSGQSSPNARAITAVVANATEVTAATPSPGDPSLLRPRDGSADSAEGSRSVTSSNIPAMNRSGSFGTVNAAAPSGQADTAVPPPLASGPTARPQAAVGNRPREDRPQSSSDGALVNSAQVSPFRPEEGEHAAGREEDETPGTAPPAKVALSGRPQGSSAKRTTASDTGITARSVAKGPTVTVAAANDFTPEPVRPESFQKHASRGSSLARSQMGESPVAYLASIAASRLGGGDYAGLRPRKTQSESFLNDSRLYAGTVGAAESASSPVGINNSGYTPSQRALVQYEPSIPRDVTTPSYAYQGPLGAGSDGGYSPSRHAEIRAMLIAVERELAEVRDECAKRGMKLEATEATLDRERANTRALRDRFSQDAAAAREEHEAQTRQLRDQLHVLKMVSENAMAERSKMVEEATRRKKELLGLLDREREEKSYIMADYREQTESLIAEQGREITSLRAALEKLKGDYEELSKQNEATEEERDSLETHLDELNAQLDREREEAASKIKNLQANTQQECDAMRAELEGRQEQLQRAAAQQARKQQELVEQLQKCEERQRIADDNHQHTLETLKQAYRRDTDGLREELLRVRETRDKQDEELRREADKAFRREAKAVESLRQQLEQVRKEKEACVDEGFQHRESLQRQHREKLAALQAELDALTQQLAEERTARKDSEADAEVLRVRADNLDKASQRLSSELETLQAEQRTRERAIEKDHQAAIEETRTKLRTAVTDLGYVQEQLTQQAADAQQLREELAKRTSALEAAKEKLNKREVTFQDEVAKLKDGAAQREREAAQALAQMRAGKTQLETTCEKLERQVKDFEGRVQGTAKQVEEERRSLEEAHRQLQDAKVTAEELRGVVGHERERAAAAAEEKQQLERQLEDAKLYRDELENALHMSERRLQEQQHDQGRAQKQMEGKLEELAQRHRAEVAAARMAAEQVRGEVVRARETLVEKEAALQKVREEVGRLHREAAMREGGLQEDIEDLREAHELEMRRMDELLNGLRSDLAKSQAMCTQYQRELSHIHRNSDGERSDLEAALEQSDAARVKLLEDAKYRDQLNQELQGTVRLLSSRLTANEEEVRRMQEELLDTNKKIQDAHTLIGRKDATVGQLNAKLRAYEARAGATTVV